MLNRAMTRAALLLSLLPTLALSAQAAPNMNAPSIYVAYPPAQYRVSADHVILEGSVTPGRSLTVNGKRLKVGPDGLFMEWWPLNAGLNTLNLVSGNQSTRLQITRTVNTPLPSTPTTIDAKSVAPQQNVEFWDIGGDSPEERRVAVSFRGSVGGRAAAWVGQQAVQALREGPAGTYSGWLSLPAQASFSAVGVQVRLTGKDGRTVMAISAGKVSAQSGGPRLGVQRLGTVQGLGLNDAANSVTALDGETFLYPRDGMTFTLVGRQGQDVRARLSGGPSVLISASQLNISDAPSLFSSAAPALPSPPVALTPVLAPLGSTEWEWRWPLQEGLQGGRPPFTLTQTGAGQLTLTVYGAPVPPLPTADGFLQQAKAGAAAVTLDFATAQLWGFHANYDGSDLVLRVRRPPALTAGQPLLGRTITIDPGHGGDQNGGAGSLRVPEKDLVLPIALRVAELLQQKGANVQLTRSSDTATGLYERDLLAESNGSDLLVSIHANALPDGRDPRGIRGPEVFFTHQQARSVSAAILEQIRRRLPELGGGKGLMPGANLALTRPTTQISLLVETAYLTDAGNLRTLMSEGGRERLSQAIAGGIADFYAAQARQ